MTGRAYIGISGWRYARWRGDFYPKGLQQRRELEYAAERFNSVEINGSFYSLQRPSSYRAWAAQTPPGFVFAVKGGRYITHMLRLQNADAALGNFFASGVLALEDRLGPVLWQLPGRQEFEADRVAAFLSRLPRSTRAAEQVVLHRDEKLKGEPVLAAQSDLPIRHALEVRHESWATEEAEELLREHDVSFVVSDGAGAWPLLRRITSDHVYVRLHGDEELYVSGYSPAALAGWAGEVRGWLDGSGCPDGRPRDVYVYFDNDAKGYAPWDALELTRLVRDGG
ncbi:MAG: hypothetical protein JWR33_2232 [Naasia sp.]|jgi:uncharacterized protein YecE (DUF72 family)|uniref:DUF72 domain-containing protein n=1 Tax=Naasia sp. TaxID=2546198 RepID=UPI002614FF09|nr:DUF72 domain-containing protein [Naasia sp.]MCU1571491.1 hypothetical protein [Naasia sp.]